MPLRTPHKPELNVSFDFWSVPKEPREPNYRCDPTFLFMWDASYIIRFTLIYFFALPEHCLVVW